MKRTLAVLVATALACVAFASDENLERGIPGSYYSVRGMESTVIDLKPDGVYVITCHSCLTAEEEGRGRWTIRNGVLILDRSGDSKERRSKLSKFDIEVLAGDIALRPQNDVVAAENPGDESRLFRHQKKEANQSADSTTSAGTSAAGQPRVPASAASHL